MRIDGNLFYGGYQRTASFGKLSEENDEEKPESLQTAETTDENKTMTESLENTESADKKDGTAESEKQGGSVAVNVEKRSRQIASAKTPEQIRVVLSMLDVDLSDCRNGLEKGWCDESEIAKVEALIRRAQEKQGQIQSEGSDGNENDFQDMSFLLNMII